MSWQGVVAFAGGIAIAVALVEFLVRGLREWQAARRIVPIATLDAHVVEEWGLVPTQFAGSRSRVVRALLGLYGFLLVTPRTRKSVFLCTAVSGAGESDEIVGGGYGPGGDVRIVLADGERAASFVKALRRGGSGG